MKNIMCVVALASVSVLAQASDHKNTGYYLGAEFGRTQVEDTLGDTDKAATGIFGGYKFTNNLSLEVGYRNLLEGSIDLFVSEGNIDMDTHTTYEHSAIQLSGQYLYPIDENFGVSVRLGFANIKSEADVKIDYVGRIHQTSGNYTYVTGTKTGSYENSDIVVFLGVGAEYQLNQITFRANYDMYEESADLEMSLFTIGAAWNF